MREALREIIRFLFEDVQVNRIVAYHAKENPVSGKVMKKVGMTFCKMVAGAYTCHAGTFDSYYYSIKNQ